MDVRIDSRSPVPLYHQIAEAIRYRIATGEVVPGTVLPPLRVAAERWGVNLHTVRRAYAELAAAGFIETRRPMGSRVLPPPSLQATADRRGRAEDDARLRKFARATLRAASERHGLGVESLVTLLRSESMRGETALPPRGVPIYVVECSSTQAEDLASQLRARVPLDALPWSLDQGEPPRGLVVATFFHYNDVRLAWPHRLDHTVFTAIRPDPDLASRLLLRPVIRPVTRRSKRRATERQGAERSSGGPRRRRVVTVCEREPAMAANIAADLSLVLPVDRFEVRTRVVASAASVLSDRRIRGELLFAPRLWGELTEVERLDPRAHEVRYVFDEDDLARAVELLVDLGRRHGSGRNGRSGRAGRGAAGEHG